LGIDPVNDKGYLWLAREALNAELPPGWVSGEGEGEYEGLLYYHNEDTGESTWDHPLDEIYRQKFLRLKAKGEGQRPLHGAANMRALAGLEIDAELHAEDADEWEEDDEIVEEVVEDVEDYSRETRERARRASGGSGVADKARSDSGGPEDSSSVAKDTPGSASTTQMIKQLQEEKQKLEREAANALDEVSDLKQELAREKKAAKIGWERVAKLEQDLASELTLRKQAEEKIPHERLRIAKLELDLTAAKQPSAAEHELSRQVEKLKLEAGAMEGDLRAQAQREAELEEELTMAKLAAAREAKKASAAKQTAGDAVEWREKLFAAEAALAAAQLSLSEERERSAMAKAKVDTQGGAADSLRREAQQLAADLAAREAAMEVERTQAQTEIGQLKARGDEWRRKVAELQAAYDSLQREVGSAHDGEIGRVREAERLREAASYEKMRALEKAATAEQLRAEAAERADKVSRELAQVAEECAALKLQIVRQKGSVEEERRAMQAAVDDAAAVADKLRTQILGMVAQHEAELSSINAEVASKMPEIAAAALKRAQEQLRPSVEAAIASARREGEIKVKELMGRLRSFEESAAQKEAQRSSTERVAADVLREENASLREQLQAALSDILDLKTKVNSEARFTPVRNQAPAATPNRSSGASDRSVQWLFPPSPISSQQYQQQPHLPPQPQPQYHVDHQQQSFISSAQADYESASHRQAMAALKVHIDVLQAQTRQLVQQSALALAQPTPNMNWNLASLEQESRVDELLQRVRSSPAKTVQHPQQHWASNILDPVAYPTSSFVSVPEDPASWDASRINPSLANSSAISDMSDGGFHTGYWKQRYSNSSSKGGS
jgi:centrosomal protein CEP164